MTDFHIMWRGDRVIDTEPAPLGEAAAAAVESLRLAWAADRGGLAGMVALTAAASTAELVQLLASKAALDAAFTKRSARTQGPRLVMMGGLAIVGVAGQTLSSTLQTRLAGAVSRRAEARVLDVVAAMELADVEDPTFQDRLQRALIGANREGELLRRTLGVPVALTGVGNALAALTANDRVLVPLATAGALAQWVITSRTQDPMRAFGMRSREGREAGFLRHLLTGTQAAHELRAFGAAPVLRARHDTLVQRAIETQKQMASTNARMMFASNLAGKAAAAPAAGRLVLGVAGTQTSVAGAVAGGLAANRLNSGFQRLVGAFAGIRRTAAAAGDYREFVASPTPARGGIAPDPEFERITVEDLSFTYRGGDRPILHGVDFEIRRGEVVALVGENGSGKTTLAKLLCCLYRPTKGTIRWDELDLDLCDPVAVRSRIAVVFQDFMRYGSLSAADNIGLGLPERLGDREAIIDAARQAGVDETIGALPNGYDTVLSRAFGGIDLSTGQWQRVALARAFLRNAPLVVLDEPTAALDPRAERDLFEAVASLYRSRSALLISHRLSSVRFADRICVLAGGRIIENGTHEQLLAAGGTYAELFELQARAYR